MKVHSALAVSAIVLATAGCQTYTRTPEQIRADNTETLQALMEAQDESAIISQRTILPYHFVAGTASLNPRGAHVLEVLSAHFKENSGVLSMPQREEGESLYNSRKESVRAFLVAQGVDMDRVLISPDRPPAGGVTSEEMRLKLVEERNRKSGQGSQGGAAGTVMNTLGAR